MPGVHLTLAERIGTGVFVTLGWVAGTLPDALARRHSIISSKQRQGSSKSCFVPGLLTAGPEKDGRRCATTTA